MNRPKTSRRWLRSFRTLFAGSPPATVRRTSNSRLRLTHLEDRVTPAVDVLANLPEANQQSLTANFTQSETASIAFGSTVIVAFNDSGSNAGGNRFTGYARSTDNGATFTDMGILSSANNDAGDPVLARDNTSGRIYLSTLAFTGGGIQIFRSDNDGQTFGAPINCFTQSGANMDKEWMAVDNFGGAGQGNVYVIGRDFGATGGIVFTRSTDGGSTWSPAQTIVSGNQGAFVVVNADHSVNVFWLQGGTPQTIRTRRSTDGGLTFGPTITAATLLTTGVNGDLGLTRTTTDGFRSNAFPSVAANPAQPGVLYMAYADNPAGADKANVMFTQSNDFGATWSAPVAANTDGTTRDQWQPAVQVTPNGQRLSIGWYDRRLDANNSLIDYFARIASISGTTTTFAADFRVSDVSFAPDFGRDNVVNSVYMGDYDQGAATNSRFFYVWADNRLGGPDIRVDTVPIAGGGPFVFAASPQGITNNPTPITLTFDQAMDPASFSFVDDVLEFSRNGTDVRGTLTTFAWSAGNTVLTINHTSNLPGAYTLRLGTQVLSAVGGLPQDNDIDGTPGEIPDDQYVLNFIVPFARIVSGTPSGTVAPPVSSATFNFSQVMDTNSFDVASDVFSFTGPAGNLIPFISGFQWVTNQQLRIDFASQSIPGNYVLVLNPSILSANSFQLDNNNNGTAGEVPADRFSITYSIGSAGGGSSNAFGYRFAAIPFNPALNLVPGAPGVTQITALNAVDDTVTTVSLGGNSFNYYGQNFSSVTVSSNGNIQFGGANNAFTNTDLQASPAEAIFSGFWDDLITSRNTATDDVVLSSLQDVTGDGQPDLTVCWRNVHFFAGPAGNNDGITFSLVLQLNTGTTAGALIANFADLDEPGATGNTGGLSATVGIKRAGTDPATGDPLVAALNGNNPTLVGSNKAVRFFRNTAPTANANGPYTVAAGGTVALSSTGTSDPEGDPLTIIWDLDNDGTFGETGAGALRGDETGPSPTFNAAGAPGGANPIALRVFDTSGEVGNATSVVNVTGGAAPRVSTVQVNGSNNAQRSSVRNLVVTFDANVTLPSNVADAFRLEKLGVGGGDVTLAGSAQVVGGVTVVTLTFSGAFTEGAGSFLTNPSLVDGNYRLTARANQITVGGLQLDGDGNGTGGDDFVLGNTAADNLYRLYGDVTGDRTNNAADFGQFRPAFGASQPDPAYKDFLDFNGDGTINAFDFGQYRPRFGINLPFP